MLTPREQEAYLIGVGSSHQHYVNSGPSSWGCSTEWVHRDEDVVQQTQRGNSHVLEQTPSSPHPSSLSRTRGWELLTAYQTEKWRKTMNNWWQTPYNSYNPMPPPPSYWGGQPNMIPIPPGTDPIKVMEFMDRVQRRAAKAKEKEPKKEEKKQEVWKTIMWYFQAACVLYFLSPPIAALQHLISTIYTVMMK